MLYTHSLSCPKILSGSCQPIRNEPFLWPWFLCLIWASGGEWITKDTFQHQVWTVQGFKQQERHEENHRRWAKSTKFYLQTSSWDDPHCGATVTWWCSWTGRILMYLFFVLFFSETKFSVHKRNILNLWVISSWGKCRHRALRTPVKLWLINGLFPGCRNPVCHVMNNLANAFRIQIPHEYFIARESEDLSSQKLYKTVKTKTEKTNRDTTKDMTQYITELMLQLGNNETTAL